MLSKSNAMLHRAIAFTRARIQGREIAVSLAAAGILTAGFVGTTSALATSASAPEHTPSAAVVDASARQDAADRADRSSREAAAPATAPVAPAPAQAPAPPPPAWVNPMPGVRLSSCYGHRWGAMHRGIDFAGDAGTPIRAVGAGTVIGAGWLSAGYGQSVLVDHGNGYQSHYAHASRVLVSPGQTVVAGEPIALEGSTGNSTGPHLHFEIHHGLWNQVEPAAWLRGLGVEIGC